MRTTLIIGGLLASVMIVPALAQSKSTTTDKKEAPAAQAPANKTDAASTAPRSQSNLWRASKIKGLNVYNDQNEKLGDISEILIDKSGKVEGVVIGVGGFLGMGEHDIKVAMSKLKFVDEPVRTSATTTTAKTNGAAGSEPGTPAAQRATVNQGTSATDTARSTERNWYPDHAVLSGVNKDQLKSMPQFKFD